MRCTIRINSLAIQRTAPVIAPAIATIRTTPNRDILIAGFVSVIANDPLGRGVDVVLVLGSRITKTGSGKAARTTATSAIAIMIRPMVIRRFVPDISRIPLSWFSRNGIAKCRNRRHKL